MTTFLARAGRRGFTLVELLVVIGIIALLISILLPTLSSARKASKALVCLSNQRQIGQGLLFYTNAYNGYLPGSNLTSTVGLFADASVNNNNVPVRLGAFDWVTPIAEGLDINFNDGPTLDDRANRYLELLGPGSVFACPDNTQGIATKFGSIDVGAMPFISYSTGALFMYVQNDSRDNSYPNPKNLNLDRIIYPQYYNMSQGYSPKITRVGDGSSKAFIGDGGRFVNGGLPTYNFRYDANTGGNFATWGAFSRFSRGMQRAAAPANQGQSNDTFDSRLLWARHGGGTPGARGNAFDTNLLFYDGHAEKMGDLTASNPVYWMPPGTAIELDEFWNDTRESFLGSNPVTNSQGEWVSP